MSAVAHSVSSGWSSVTTTRTFGLAAGEQPAPGYVWPTHREPAGQSNPSTLAVSRGPELPFRHPDLLVHRAVELRVLEAADAAAWIEVRLARRLSKCMRRCSASPSTRCGCGSPAPAGRRPAP
jgi:hypothetical protein